MMIEIRSNRVDPREMAAMKIQAWFRSKMVQSRFRLFLYSYVCSVRIQSLWRGHIVRKQTKKDLRLASMERRLRKQEEEIQQLRKIVEGVVNKLQL